MRTNCCTDEEMGNKSYCEENLPTEFSTSYLFKENARDLKLLLIIQLPVGEDHQFRLLL